MKKIYYLLGMPRAGNTLFGSLLNQNPRVRVTAKQNNGTRERYRIA